MREREKIIEKLHEKLKEFSGKQVMLVPEQPTFRGASNGVLS
jgi:hypothetical protein|tara:strand:+ start:1897 stop:2022 length:126 start_codon:yes stop_codon:yes gene_type:complete